MPEGNLTKLRASLVCEPTLAFCAREIGLPEWLLLGKGEERTGGRLRNSIVSDAMEAVIGAIFLDGGFDAARSFIHRFILNDIEHKRMFTDSKTILQEVIQRDFKSCEVKYCVTDETGPDHNKSFTVALNMDTGITAVFSMSFMRWIRIRKIWVTPQNAESPRIESRTIG